MKLTIASTAIAAVLATAAAAGPASAQDYGYTYRAYDQGYACDQAKHDSAATGTVLGGLFGALFGGGVAGRGHHTEGAVIGGLTGAMIGNGVGRSSARDSGACAYGGGYVSYARPYRDAGYRAYGQSVSDRDGYAPYGRADAWGDHRDGRDSYDRGYGYRHDRGDYGDDDGD
jgi:hypothetical protein